MQKRLLIGVACIGIVALVLIDRWQAAHWRIEKTTELRATADLCQHRLVNAIASRFNAVGALASLFAIHPETKPDEFASFAALLLQSNPPIRGLQFADAETRVTYVYPPKGNEITIRKPMLLLEDPKRGPYVEKAISERRATVQGPFELRQGGTGIVVRFPIFVAEKFTGLTVGIYDVPVLVEEALAGIDTTQFVYRLADSEGRFFFGPENTFKDYYEKSIPVADSMWTMTLSWADGSASPPGSTRMLIWVFGGGFLLTTLLLIRRSWTQAQHLEKTVEERTKELSESNRALIEEIGERKLAEEALRRSETLFRAITKQSGEGISLCNPDGNYITVNPAFCQMTGYSEAELLTMNVRDLVPPETDITLFSKVVNREMGHRETELTRKDKSRFLAEISGYPIKLEDQWLALGIVRDVTDRKSAEKERERLQAQLTQAHKMEAIGTLAGGIAHDFNNILTPILGYTEIVRSLVQDQDDVREYLDRVLKAANRAKDLVEHILTFSRRTDQKPEPLQIQLIVKEALKFLRSSIPSTIEIKENIDPKCMFVLAEATQIHQVIMNLCTNAHHAMREMGGVLAVSLKQVDLSSENHLRGVHLVPGNYLKLEVSDTGCGMPPWVLERVFDPYFTTKTQGEGTGIGLSIVHGIINSYKGKITVYSEPNKGTTFKVYLPCLKMQSLTGMEKVPVVVPTGRERVLLVDDEDEIVQMEKLILEDLGYSVTPMTSSVETLTVFQNHPDRFDLVITDMTMPEITGAELARRIMSIRPNMPVILCTGYSDFVNKNMAKSLGISKYLEKPITRRELANATREALNDRKS